MTAKQQMEFKESTPLVAQVQHPAIPESSSTSERNMKPIIEFSEDFLVDDYGSYYTLAKKKIRNSIILAPSNNQTSPSSKSNRVTISTFYHAVKSQAVGHQTLSQRTHLRKSKFIRVEGDDFKLATDEEEAGDEEPKFLLSLVPDSAAIFLFHNPEHRLSDPNTYLQAASEVMAFTIASCWILTLIFNPHIFEENPLKDRLGYNDLCIGWDTLPANVIGIVGTAVGCHLGLRFVALNDMRMKLLGAKLSPKVHFVGRLTSKAYALSVILMPIIFVIPPTVSVWFHSLPFMMFIVSSALVLFSRFVMFQDELSRTRALYIASFCFLSFLFPTILICEYLYFEINGQKSPWPSTITMVVDYTWFSHLCVLPFMLPNDIILVRTMELARKSQ